MERDRVDGPHRVERRRVEDREDRRIGRSGAGREHLLVETAEVVDRLRLRHPEGPRVERLQALQARRAEERLEQETHQGDPRRRHEQGGGRPLLPARAPPGRARPSQAHSGRAGDRRPEEQREEDRPSSERDAHHEELRPDDPERGDTDQVAEAGQPEHVRPPREPTEGPEHRHAHDGERPVQGEQARDRAHRHDARRRSERPSSPSHTTSAPG